jgi:Fe-S oxidoreductase
MDEIKQEIKEEIQEKKTNCTLCGLCRMNCPVYKVFLNEAGGPRGKAVMLKQNVPSRHFYLCTLCKACKQACILKDLDLDEKIRKFRQDLVELGMTTEANEKMIENIRRYGNTVGPVDESNKKKVELFCC